MSPSFAASIPLEEPPGDGIVGSTPRTRPGRWRQKRSSLCRCSCQTHSCCSCCSRACRWCRTRGCRSRSPQTESFEAGCSFGETFLFNTAIRVTRQTSQALLSNTNIMKDKASKRNFCSFSSIQRLISFCIGSIEVGYHWLGMGSCYIGTACFGVCTCCCKDTWLGGLSSRKREHPLPVSQCK